MMSLKQKQQGFTIVELLIVIVIIAILAGLVYTTFTGIQQKSRDTVRTANIKGLHGALEAYYAQNSSRYPTLANMNDATWRSNNLKGLDADAIKDPKGSTTLAAAPAANTLSYEVVASDDTACDNTTKDCAKYTLTATLEGGGVFQKKSLNN
jgi:prepilin-type N-terminal cleavage/methylation domain-containing protein